MTKNKPVVVPHEPFEFELTITVKVVGHTTSHEALSSRLEYEYQAAIDKAVMAHKRCSQVDRYWFERVKLTAFRPKTPRQTSKDIVLAHVAKKNTTSS